MHILFLSDNFPPEVNAPASRTFEHCREWVKKGHQVTVITCVPNFPSGIVFSGYKNKFYQTEVIDGIKVIRVWTYITANTGFAKRILDYISFMLSSSMAALFVKKIDLVIGTSPQFFTVCGAYIVGLVKRVPFVFELRDIWPESIRAVGAINNPFILAKLEKLELFLYHQANLIVSVTHTFKEILIKRGIDGGKVEVITNGVDFSIIYDHIEDKNLLKKLDLEGKFVVGYVGTIGMAHHLETLLDVAQMVQNESDEYRFLFLGDGAKKAELIALANSKRLTNVLFIDSVPRELVSDYWSLLDVSIIHLKKSELFKSVIPSKLFECMAMGIPVLHGVLGESARIVEQHYVGIVFEPESSLALYNALLAIKNDQYNFNTMKSNGLVAARNYDRAILAAAYLELLEVAVSKYKIRNS